MKAPGLSATKSTLSALDPGKQGLKHTDFAVSTQDVVLSALDPGKQGLKQQTR